MRLRRGKPKPEPDRNFTYGEVVTWKTYWGTIRCIYLSQGWVYARVLPLDGGVPVAVSLAGGHDVELALPTELFHVQP